MLTSGNDGRKLAWVLAFFKA
ncbi:unnamed protein product [Ectocarpus sp. CCAP 1310/34]|nr:unnamed protein product [Ectocarpus sp. CCAP 1310/34]